MDEVLFRRSPATAPKQWFRLAEEKTVVDGVAESRLRWVFSR